MVLAGNIRTQSNELVLKSRFHEIGLVFIGVTRDALDLIPYLRPKGSMISDFTDVDKNEDTNSSKLQEVQQLSTRSTHLIDTGYVENRYFPRIRETALGAGALPNGESVDSTD